MRYYGPRQRVADSLWDYTCGSRPVGYCCGAGAGSQVPPYHEIGHATRDEACECYKTFLLDSSLRFREDVENAHTLRQCDAPGCDHYTSGSAWVGQYRRWDLCAEHRTRDVVAPLLEVGESWES